MYFSLELGDLVENNPSPYDRNYQSIISGKREFEEKRAFLNEKLSKSRGSFFSYQEYYHRIFRINERVLVMDDTGTGKSCTIFGFLENIIKERKKLFTGKEYDDRLASIKKVVIIAKKKQLVELRNQLVCKCTDGEYETSEVENAISEKEQSKAVKRILANNGYYFKTPEKFVNELMKNYPEGSEYLMIKDYSDTFFLMDESHNFIYNPKKKKRENDIYSKLTNKQIYDFYWNFFHSISNSKIVMNTATPMMNSTDELRMIMNIILPENGKIPEDMNLDDLDETDLITYFPDYEGNIEDRNEEEMAPFFIGQIPEDMNMDAVNIETLEPYIRSHIGYTRSNNANIKTEEQGEPIGNFKYLGNAFNSTLKVFPTVMSDFQNSVYEKIQKKDRFGFSSEQASNFIFPDGYCGSGQSESKKSKGTDIVFEKKLEQRGFSRFVIHDKKGYRATKEFIQNINSIDKIYKYSSKFSNFCLHVKNEVGLFFTFIKDVEGSGAITLGLCLEHSLNFQKFNESSSVFESISGEFNVKPYCGGVKSKGEKYNRKIKKKFKPFSGGGPLRYGVLSGELSEREQEILLETFNSYENRHGDLIKVILATEVAKEGLNIRNGVNTHILSPQYNPSKLYQIVSRTNRIGALDDLINEKIKLSKNIDNSNLEELTETIKIYYHVAIPSTESSEESTDLHIYQIAESKDYRFKRLKRILKRVSIGCISHHERNIIPGIDYSKECDYDVCDYPCYNDTPKKIDYTTYDILYIKNMIVEIIKWLTNYFRQKSYFEINEFMDFIKFDIYNGNLKYIILSLEEMIFSKIIVSNRYGDHCYVNESNGFFFLQKNEPYIEDFFIQNERFDNNTLMNYYMENNIIIEKMKFSTLLEKTRKIQNFYRVENIENEINNSLDMLLPELNNDESVIALENALLHKIVHKNISRFDTLVIEKYDWAFYEINKPIEKINEAYKKLNTLKKIKRGRKAKENKKKRIEKINPLSENIEDYIEEEIENENNSVFVHLLYTQSSSNSYLVTAHFTKAEGRLRILDNSKIFKEWSDINDIEYPIYNEIVQFENINKLKSLENNKIYGLILGDKKFKIRNSLYEDEDAKEDSRKIYRGRNCTSWKKFELIDIMWNINVKEPEFDKPIPDKKNIILDILKTYNKYFEKNELNSWEDDHLRFFYIWHNHPDYRTIIKICNFIQEFMEQNNLLIKI